jgi:RHS repeat-associated protein
VHTAAGLTTTLTNTFDVSSLGSQEGRYPATTNIDYPDRPDVFIGWKGCGVVDGVTQGLWSTSYVSDGAELKGESQYNGSTVGTTWTVWSEGERIVTTYTAPDGSVTSKDADATDWSELEYGDYTGTGTGRPGLPHCMTRKDDSGMTWDWTANVDGSTVVEVREGLLASGAVTRGTMSVSTTNGRGYVTDVEGILVQGEEELKVSGSSTPAGQFTTWGAPLKSTDYTTGLSDIRAYDGNLERLGSNTDPLGVNTAVTARDAFGRVTGYNWKGHTGTVTPGALSVGNSLNMGGGAANPSSTRTWDAMGRMLSDNQTVGGVTHARGATYNANTRTIETSNSLTGAGTSSTVNNSTNALAATGSVLPFGGVTGEDLSVENGLLLTKSKLTGKTNTYQSTWTDAWGRVRKTVTPSTASTGEDTTEYVYSDPASHIHRVTTLELSGRRTIQESDPYNTAGAITRSGVDVNLDANGGYSLDDSDRYVLTTVTLDEGVLHTEVKATGEPTGNGPATRTILITDTDPATGIVTAIPNPTDDPAVSGGEETITQQPDYEHNKVTTTSTKGWENTDTFNSLGLPTKKVLSGTGLAGSTLNSTWRDDGTLATASMIAGDPETGATSTASLGNNGLLTGLTVPLLGNIFGSHSFTNGTESITLNGTTRTASLDGTSTSATGTDIMGQTRNVVVDGSTFKNTIAPTVGANTVLTHNAAGAKTTHDYIAGPGIATTWNAGWELASISNGRGGSTIFEYSQDGARDITDITYPGAGTFSAIHEEFTHYPSGKVKTISDPSGSRLLTYDRSRLWQSTYVNVGKALDGYEVERTTDAAGRLETVTVKHKGTVIHSYTNSFNANSHEISGVDATGFSSSYNRANPDTRAITKITRGTVEQNWGRGTAGRITSAGSSISDVPITDAPSFAYTEFDSKGRRKKCTTAGFTWEYTYGTAGQLTAAVHPTLGNFSYPVDGIGRRTGSGGDSRNRFMAMAHSQQKQLIISAATTARLYINETEMTPFTGGWFYNIPSPGQDGGWVPWVVKGVLEDAGDHEPNDDAIAEVAGYSWVPPANESFTYDADGNRESSALWNYGWDGRNMLVSATTKNYSESPEGWQVTFDYDAEGRRFKKTIIHKTTNGEQVKETLDNVTFIWDGWNLVYERHANQLGTRTFDRKYVWGEDLGGGTGGASGAGGAGGLLLIRETRGQAAPVDYYPLYDGSGHVVGLTDSAGTLVAQYTYGPFGELISASGPMADANPIRYATKYFDKETGLYYYGGRYYDPVTGQWLSREPLGEDESLNLNSYCHNDPVNNVDRLGLATTLVSGGASISTEIPNFYKVCRQLADTSTLNIADTAVMDLIALPYLEDYVAAHPLLKPDMSREAFLTYLPIAVLNASIVQLDAFADTEGLDAKTKKWVHQVSQARSNSAHDWQLFSGTFNGAMFIAQPETVFLKGAAAGFLAVKGLGKAASWGGSIARLGDDAVEMRLAAKEVIGARHISSDASYLEDLLRSGEIPANSRGTYFTLDEGYDALTTFRMQIPHDGAIRIEFPLGQLGADIHIPFGNYGKGPHLEPIARDFPDFGFGGASQRITKSSIRVSRVIDTRTGKILFQRQ